MPAFYQSFFGDNAAVPFWERKYGLEILPVDISDEYCQMLCSNPANGFGSALNPCVDCKIIMMKKAKALMAEYGAKFLISGEVLGQRPMSQRRDTLNVIRRDAEVRDILLRPLSALHMEALPVELSGEVDREKLLGLYGRGRKEQLSLAKRFNIVDIPTAGGGCKLTEKENARRYYEVMQKVRKPSANDFFWQITDASFGTEIFGSVSGASRLITSKCGNIKKKAIIFCGLNISQVLTALSVKPKISRFLLKNCNLSEVF